MKFKVFRTRSRGFTLIHIMTTGVILTLLGMMGWQTARYATRRADMQRLLNRGNNLATCLNMYQQSNNRFPDAYPARLEVDLAPYADSLDLFVDSANPGAGADSLNRSYVTPVLSQDHTYVLSLNSEVDPNRTVVVYADSSARVARRLPIYHGGEKVQPGTVVEGGTVVFGDTSTIELSDYLAMTIVQSFVGDDDNAYNVVKFNRSVPGTMTAAAADAGVVKMASAAGVTFVRGGIADMELLQEDGKDYAKVFAEAGEIIVNGSVISQGMIAGASTASVLFSVDGETFIDTQNMEGEININPNNSFFQFELYHYVYDDGEQVLDDDDKPVTEVIRRQDLLRDRTIEYSGEAYKVLVRPIGNANQNTLEINGEPYRLHNGTTYTFEGDLDVYLRNEGRGMGQWWISIRVNSPEPEEEEEGNGDEETTEAGDGQYDDDYEVGTIDGDDGASEESDSPARRRWFQSSGLAERILGRGTPVREGRWVKVTGFNR